MFQHRTAQRPPFALYGKRDDHRPARQAVADHDEGPGLLVSPAFWIGGLLSLSAWVALAAALKLF